MANAPKLDPTTKRRRGSSPMGATRVEGTVTVDPRTGIVTTWHDRVGKLIGGKSESKDK